MSSAPVRFGVVVFPGSNCDADSYHAISTFPGASVQYLWHKDTDLNGALDDIAGVCNEARNVFGMMPHPENSVEAELAGGAGGRALFQSIIDTLMAREVAR